MISAGDNKMMERARDLLCGRSWDPQDAAYVDQTCEDKVKDAFEQHTPGMDENEMEVFKDSYAGIAQQAYFNCLNNPRVGLPERSLITADHVTAFVQCTASYVKDVDKILEYDSGTVQLPYNQMVEHMANRAKGLVMIGYERIELPQNLKNFLNGIDNNKIVGGPDIYDANFSDDEKKMIKQEAERIFREAMKEIPMLDEAGKAQRAKAAVPVGKQIVDNMWAKAMGLNGVNTPQAKDEMKHKFLYAIVVDAGPAPDYKLDIREANPSVSNILGMEEIPPQLRALYADAFRIFVEKGGTDDTSLAAQFRAAVVKQLGINDLKDADPEKLRELKVDDVVVDGASATEVKIGKRGSEGIPQEILDAVGIADQHDPLFGSINDLWLLALEKREKMSEKPSKEDIAKSLADQLRGKNGMLISATYIDAIDPASGQVHLGVTPEAASAAQDTYDKLVVDHRLGDPQKGAYGVGRHFTTLYSKEVAENPSLDDKKIAAAINKYVAKPELYNDERLTSVNVERFLSVTDIDFKTDVNGNITGATYTLENGDSLGKGAYLASDGTHSVFVGVGAKGNLSGMDGEFMGDGKLKLTLKYDYKGVLETGINVGYGFVRNGPGLWMQPKDKTLNLYPALDLYEDGKADSAKTTDLNAEVRGKALDSDDAKLVPGGQVGIVSSSLPNASEIGNDHTPFAPAGGPGFGGSTILGLKASLDAHIKKAGVVLAPQVILGDANGQFLTLEGTHIDGFKLGAGLMAKGLIHDWAGGAFGDATWELRASVGGGKAWGATNPADYEGVETDTDLIHVGVGSDAEIPLNGSLKLHVGVGYEFARQNSLRKGFDENNENIPEDEMPDSLLEIWPNQFQSDFHGLGFGLSLPFEVSILGRQTPMEFGGNFKYINFQKPHKITQDGADDILEDAIEGHEASGKIDDDNVGAPGDDTNYKLDNNVVTGAKGLIWSAWFAVHATDWLDFALVYEGAAYASHMGINKKWADGTVHTGILQLTLKNSWMKF